MLAQYPLPDKIQSDVKDAEGKEQQIDPAISVPKLLYIDPQGYASRHLPLSRHLSALFVTTAGKTAQIHPRFVTTHRQYWRAYDFKVSLLHSRIDETSILSSRNN